MEPQNNLPIQPVQEKRFSPVQAGWGKVLFTFFYLLLVINGVFAALYFNHVGVLDGRSAMIEFLDFLGEGGIIYCLAIPIIWTIIIHKSFIKGAIVAFVSIVLFLVFIIPHLSSEEMGYLLLGIIPLMLIIDVWLGVGFLLRGFFRLKKPIRIIISVAPFIIIALLFASTIINAKEIPAKQESLQDAEGKESTYTLKGNY